MSSGSAMPSQTMPALRGPRDSEDRRRHFVAVRFLLRQVHLRLCAGVQAKTDQWLALVGGRAVALLRALGLRPHPATKPCRTPVGRAVDHIVKDVQELRKQLR